MPRLTRIYTRKGDDVTTGLGGGQRVPKDSARVAAWMIATYPRSWQRTWHCKGTYNPATGRLH